MDNEKITTKELIHFCSSWVKNKKICCIIFSDINNEKLLKQKFYMKNLIVTPKRLDIITETSLRFVFIGELIFLNKKTDDFNNVNEFITIKNFIEFSIEEYGKINAIYNKGEIILKA